MSIIAISLPFFGHTQEACLEPIRPDLTDIIQSEETAQTIRLVYKSYFKDAESYLNCLNHKAASVRSDVRAEAYNFDRALKNNPIKNPVENTLKSDAELIDSGVLFLSSEFIQ